MEKNVSIKDVYDLIQGLVKKNEEIVEQNNKIKEELKNEIKDLKKDICEEFLQIRDENAKLKKENENLKQRLLVNERKHKKYNLILYGMKEKDNELEDIQTVLELFNTKLNVVCSYTDLRDIYRIYTKNGKIKPILIEFVNYKLKKEIQANAKELKGSGIYISNDYTTEDYKKQKILRAHLKKARLNNKEATIKNNILIINNKKFTYEDLINKENTAEEGQKNQEEEFLEVVGSSRSSSVHSSLPMQDEEQEGNKSSCSQNPKKRKKKPYVYMTTGKRSNRVKK